MEDFSNRRYTADEFDRIIRLALKKDQDDKVSHQDLLNTAKEMGIDPKTIEAAIRQEQEEYEAANDEAAKFKKRKEDFKKHLWSYIIVITFLMLLNIFTGGFSGDWWFQWPALGWGMGIAFHLHQVYYPDEDEEDEWSGKGHRKRCC